MYLGQIAGVLQPAGAVLEEGLVVVEDLKAAEQEPGEKFFCSTSKSIVLC